MLALRFGAGIIRVWRHSRPSKIEIRSSERLYSFLHFSGAKDSHGWPGANGRTPVAIGRRCVEIFALPFRNRSIVPRDLAKPIRKTGRRYERNLFVLIRNKYNPFVATANFSHGGWSWRSRRHQICTLRLSSKNPECKFGRRYERNLFSKVSKDLIPLVAAASFSSGILFGRFSVSLVPLY